MSPTPERARGWMADGRTLLDKACRTLAERTADLSAPTGLPGWSRAHVLAHLACGAEALQRLARWAETGVENPMYASMEQRAADIETGSALPYHQLMGRVQTTSDDLDAAIAELPWEAWTRPVVTAQGRTVPFSDVPWMRARETLVHSVDLDAGLSFADLPPGFCRDLLDEATARLSKADAPALLLMAPGKGSWTVSGAGASTTVVASIPELTRWVLGRGADDLEPVRPGPLPVLPRWL